MSPDDVGRIPGWWRFYWPTVLVGTVAVEALILVQFIIASNTAGSFDAWLDKWFYGAMLCIWPFVALIVVGFVGAMCVWIWQATHKKPT